MDDNKSSGCGWHHLRRVWTSGNARKKESQSRGSRERRTQVRLTFPSQKDMGEPGDMKAWRVSRRAEWPEAADASEKPRKARERTLGLIRRGPLPHSNLRARWRQQTHCSGLRSQQEERYHVIIPDGSWTLIVSRKRWRIPG